MNLKEFVEIGLLQEINRRILHPMGLALSVHIDDDGKCEWGDIWDYRNDPEGIRFLDGVLSEQKYKNVEELLMAKKLFREKSLGYFIQPVDSKENK